MIGSFDTAYKSQMELFLRWLDRYERWPGEKPPIGLILCGEKNREQIELLQLDWGRNQSGGVPGGSALQGELEARLHETIRLARGRLERSL